MALRNVRIYYGTRRQTSDSDYSLDYGYKDKGQRNLKYCATRRRRHDDKRVVRRELDDVSKGNDDGA